MARLFWSADYPCHWIGFSMEAGYVLFPAERDGWRERRPLHGFDPATLREIPSRLAFNTGFPMDAEYASNAA